MPEIRIDIEEAVKLLETELHPSDLADLKIRLAGEYFFLSGRMDLCDKKERQFNLELDRSADELSEAKRKRIWKSTEWGIEQTLVKNKMRAITRLTSAVSSKLRVMEEEARMNY